MAEVRSIARSPTAAGFVLGRKLDNIPFSPYHLAIIALLGFVGFVEGYDLSITGSLLVLAKHPLHLTPTDIRFVAVASTLMAVVGGFTASAMSDHWSRKLVMLSAFTATRVYLSEQFPTALRGRGHIFGELFGRIFAGVLAPFLLAPHTGSPAIFFGTILVVVGVGAFIPVLFGRETVGQLETVTEGVPAFA